MNAPWVNDAAYLYHFMCRSTGEYVKFCLACLGDFRIGIKPVAEYIGSISERLGWLLKGVLVQTLY